MAEFGETPKSVTEDLSDRMKQPIKKLEPAINRFTKIAIPLDLERLANHCKNIQKFQNLQQWDKLRAEQINARRTVQQLKANVREMEKVRLQISEGDLKVFDDQVSPVKEEVIQAVVRVIKLCGVETSPLDPPVMTQSLIGSMMGFDDGLRSRLRHTNSLEASTPGSSSDSTDVATDDASGGDFAETCLIEQQQQHQIQDFGPSQEVQESWNHLKEELVELNSLTHEFSTQVQAQQEMVDSIEHNVSTSQMNVTSGVKSLLKASTYKAAMLPLGGALIGGIMGGPVGLVVGIKTGTAVALGGSAIGFISGHALKKRSEKKLQMEMAD